MWLLGYLDKVRQRPEIERRRLLVVWTSLGTLLIVGGWIFNLLFILPTPKVDPQTASSTVKVIEPEKSFFTRITDNLERVKVGFQVLTEITTKKVDSLK
ncbi:MAG: hypothetical protein K8Q91_01010 [Candidatus Vogelbacteria bacterium]|nr:hypothetical protein [Candidatus Vogelbacteria bacterium]